MDNRKERIQPAVRKETEHVMVYTAAGVAGCGVCFWHCIL